MTRSRCFLTLFLLPVAASAFHSPSGFGVACRGRASERRRTGGRVESAIHGGRYMNLRAGGSLALFQSRVDVTSPTPDEAAALGARDWPQQIKRGSWSERIDEGKSATRYVLDGAGTVESTTTAEGGDATRRSRVGPGTLVEATGPAELEWTVDGGGDMIILTPGFEEGGLLLGVAAAFVVLCGALISGAGGGP